MRLAVFQRQMDYAFARVQTQLIGQRIGKLHLCASALPGGNETPDWRSANLSRTIFQHTQSDESLQLCDRHSTE
jgi:hypothetical protein